MFLYLSVNILFNFSKVVGIAPPNDALTVLVNLALNKNFTQITFCSVAKLFSNNSTMVRKEFNSLKLPLNSRFTLMAMAILVSKCEVVLISFAKFLF